MIFLLPIIVGLFLLVFSILDWKLRAIPSIMLTAMIFVVAVLNPANLWFGAMAFIMAYLLYEAGFFSGVADIKVMTIIGFMLSTTNMFFLFIILTMVFGFVWMATIKWRMRKSKQTAFVPVFLFVYVALYILGAFL